MEYSLKSLIPAENFSTLAELSARSSILR
jgi:hypothetical protein